MSTSYLAFSCDKASFIKIRETQQKKRGEMERNKEI